MKKIKLASLLVLFITAFTFTSCDNEPIDSAIDLNDFDNGGGGSNTGSFTAKIGDENFNANQVIEADYTSTAFGTQLSLLGVSSTGKTMIIQVLNPTIGTRAGNGDINTLLFFNYNASVNDQYTSINTTTNEYNGTITITEFNTTTNKVSGTFSFTGYGALSSTAQVEVTQGVFTNISFENSVTTTPTNPTTDDAFFAKVNGVDFVENTIDVAEVNASGFPDSYSIVGAKSNGDRIGLRFSQALAVGTYPFDGPFNQDVASTALLGGVLYTSTTGTFTITSKTATRIAGTFQLAVINAAETDVKEITEGTFDVELP